MIITSGKVDMSSGRDYSRTYQSSQTSAQWYTGSGPLTQFSQEYGDCMTSNERYNSSSTPSSKGNLDSYTSTTETSYEQYLTYSYSNIVQSTKDVSNSYNDMFKDIQKKAFRSLLELIRNLRFRSMFNDSEYYDQLQSDASSQSSHVTNSGTLSLTNSESTVLTWNVQNSYSNFMEEKECTTFNGTGSVVTADGQEIPFNVSFEMSRDYMEANSIEYISQYSQVLTDPLVINLDYATAEVSDQKFMFDLDSDGKEEEISQLGSSSGFLALDKNGDGKINDGSELFGTQSGDGFKDLSNYDSDGNGWIDEADEIYDRLKVWTKDVSGNDKLLSLKEADIGAIYLGNTSTGFSLNDDTNKTNAQIQSTGIFLHESGAAGTIQHINFAHAV